jgi:hypothetical protein
LALAMSTALKMLLVNPLDLFVEGTTRLLARVTGWRLEERPVGLAVLDPAHPRQLAEGRIQQVLPTVMTEGADGTTRHHEPFLVVRLSTPLSLEGERIDHLVAGPRYLLNRSTRLILTGWIANLYRVPPPAVVAQEPWVLGEIIAIGELRCISGTRMTSSRGSSTGRMPSGS